MLFVSIAENICADNLTIKSSKPSFYNAVAMQYKINNRSSLTFQFESVVLRCIRKTHRNMNVFVEVLPNNILDLDRSLSSLIVGLNFSSLHNSQLH